MEERKSRYELFLEEEARKAQPTKRCSKCKTEKALEEFSRQSRYRDGLAYECKDCVSKRRPRKYKGSIDRFWKTYSTHTVNAGECIVWTTQKGLPKYTWEGSSIPVRRVVYKLAVGEIPEGHIVTSSCNNKRCVRHGHLITLSPEEVKIRFCNTRPVGDQNGLRKHPERAARCFGDQSGARRHPERLARGDRNGARKHPERIARGDGHYSRTHPERLARGSKNGSAKFTEESVRYVRRLASQNKSTVQILESLRTRKRIRVSEQTLQRVLRRETWAHVE